jgi:hypothetical protein
MSGKKSSLGCHLGTLALLGLAAAVATCLGCDDSPSLGRRAAAQPQSANAGSPALPTTTTTPQSVLQSELAPPPGSARKLPSAYAARAAAAQAPGTDAAAAAMATATSTDYAPVLPPPHEVAPPGQEELARKRAEWAEHEQQEADKQAQIAAWRRSRDPQRTPAPRVGVVAAPARQAASPDPTTEAVRTWYHNNYFRRSTAVSMALSRFKLASDEASTDARRTAQACQELYDATSATLTDPDALDAPLPAIAEPLRDAYRELFAAATACINNKTDERARHLAAAQKAMTDAAAALKPYRLNP